MANIKRTNTSELDCYSFIHDISSTPFYISSQKPKQTRDPIERLILAISNENLELYGESFPQKYYAEFSIESIQHLHIEYDESIKTRDRKYVYPICTSYTFLDDSIDSFVVITDVDVERYKYKNFAKTSEYGVVFPKRRNHIVFDPSKYFGTVCSGKMPRMLRISIWRDHPEHLEEYVSSNALSKIEPIELTPDLTMSKYLYVENMYTRDFMERILYNKDNTPLLSFFHLFDANRHPKPEYEPTYKIPINKSHVSTHSFIVKSEPFPYLQSGIYYPLLSKYGTVMNDLVEFQYGNTLNNTNRFKSAHVTKDILPKCVCKWMVNEINGWVSKNGGWSRYHTIAIDRITHLSNYVMIAIEEHIKVQMAKFYQLNGIHLHIEYLAIQRYDTSNKHSDVIEMFETATNHLHIHILLSECKDPIIDTHVLSPGDMLVCSGKSKCVIHDTERYMLVIMFTPKCISTTNI